MIRNIPLPKSTLHNIYFSGPSDECNHAPKGILISAKKQNSQCLAFFLNHVQTTIFTLYHVINHIAANDDWMCMEKVLSHQNLSEDLMFTIFAVFLVKNNCINIVRRLTDENVWGLKRFLLSFHIGMDIINKKRFRSNSSMEPQLLQHHLNYNFKFNSMDQFLLTKMINPDLGLDFNIIMQNGMTPLGIAAECGNRVVTKILLTSPETKIDYTDQQGKTPSWYAMNNSSSDVGDIFVEKKHLLSKRSQRYIWCYEVQKAISLGTKDKLQQLIKEDILAIYKPTSCNSLLDYDWPSKTMKPLQMAAEKNATEIIKLLILEKKDNFSRHQMQQALLSSSSLSIIPTLLLLAGTPLLSEEDWEETVRSPQSKARNWFKLMCIAGQVTETDTSFQNYVFFEIPTDEDLTSFCRLQIRRNISRHTSTNVIRDVISLKLPIPLQTYLLYGKDMNEFMKEHGVQSLFK